MSKAEYEKARRMAQKAYRLAPLKGVYPYLQVLDDLWNRDPGLKAVGKYLQNGGALK